MKEKKESSRDPAVEYQAGSTLVDEGIRFRLPLLWGMNLRLTVRPLRPGTIIRISQQVTRMEQINEGEAMVQEMLRTGGNLRHACRIVALACLNSRWRVALLSGVLARMIEWKVRNVEELFAYVSVACRQMGAQHFFFIMALTKGMNFLERKTPEKPAEDEQSGGR